MRKISSYQIFNESETNSYLLDRSFFEEHLIDLIDVGYEISEKIDIRYGKYEIGDDSIKSLVNFPKSEHSPFYSVSVTKQIKYSPHKWMENLKSLSEEIKLFYDAMVRIKKITHSEYLNYDINPHDDYVSLRLYLLAGEIPPESIPNENLSELIEKIRSKIVTDRNISHLMKFISFEIEGEIIIMKANVRSSQKSSILRLLSKKSASGWKNIDCEFETIQSKQNDYIVKITPNKY